MKMNLILINSIQTLKTNGDSSNTVYIVDEASMISDIYSDGEFYSFWFG